MGYGPGLSPCGSFVSCLVLVGRVGGGEGCVPRLLRPRFSGLLVWFRSLLGVVVVVVVVARRLGLIKCSLLRSALCGIF